MERKDAIIVEDLILRARDLQGDLSSGLGGGLKDACRRLPREPDAPRPHVNTLPDLRAKSVFETTSITAVHAGRGKRSNINQSS